MIKKMLVAVLSLGIVGSFVLPNGEVSADGFDCTLTIDANKHTWTN